MSSLASAAICLNTGSASSERRHISSARATSSSLARRFTGLSAVFSFFTWASSASNTSSAMRPNSRPRAVDTTTGSSFFSSRSPGSNQSVLGL